MSAKHKVRQQRQQRKARQVKRVEFVLYSDSERDHVLYDHLSRLAARGEAGDWIRATLYAALVGQGDQPSTSTSTEPGSGPDLSAIMAELAELKQELRRRPAAPLPMPSTPPTMHDAGDVGSPASAPAPDDDKYGGLDMSRRRRAGPAKVITPAPTPAAAPVLDARAAREARDQLLASIRSYGGAQ